MESGNDLFNNVKIIAIFLNVCALIFLLIMIDLWISSRLIIILSNSNDLNMEYTNVWIANEICLYVDYSILKRYTYMQWHGNKN